MTSAVAVRLLEREAPTSTSGGSMSLAWDLQYNDEIVKQIFLGAIYHDIGIALLPNSLVNKSGPLTLEEKLMILKHPATGYDYIRSMTFISAYIKQIVLQHHEAIDATGYPNRSPKEDIAQIAQIVGIADVFDAMTSDRPYNRAIHPCEVIEYLMGTGSKYDINVFNAFLKRIAPYPRGAIVELSNGQELL